MFKNQFFLVSLDTQPSRCNGLSWSEFQDWGCCTTVPCGVGGGDCDRDDHCEGNLVCGENNCWKDFADNGETWSTGVDCCIGKYALYRRSYNWKHHCIRFTNIMLNYKPIACLSFRVL